MDFKLEEALSKLLKSQLLQHQFYPQNNRKLQLNHTQAPMKKKKNGLELTNLKLHHAHSSLLEFAKMVINAKDLMSIVSTSKK